MKKITLILGVHNHQPVGNFGQVFEALFRQSYEPFLKILSRYPKVKFTVHTTGPLLEWLEQNQPGYLKLLGEMVKRGQVELFTGGLYEPILSILPDRDKQGQIRRLTELLEKKFKAPVQGMWVAERVWEPHLTLPLAEAGVKYIVMDDAHFKATGLREDETFGYYLMEEQGRTLGVFPISEKMRYLVPFQDVNETINYLRSVATEEGDRCVVLMDDGEKFGGWPDTYQWVYEQGWLERFLQALTDNAQWLTCATFAEFAATHPPKGPLALPTGSYTEMGEWSLPAEAAAEYERIRHEVGDRGEMPRFERYLKGGIWRNFQVKYAESNQMHKKMLWVSDKVEKARKHLAKKSTPQQKALLAKAEQALYRGQCNCPYWHGVFGGLYLNHLRFANYRQLIEAEREADALLPAPAHGIQAHVTDFNKDGRDEILVETPAFHALLEPARGGSLRELDYLKNPINLSDTLTRRREAYHAKLLAMAHSNGEGGQPASIHDRVRTKEPGLEHRLFYDRDPRTSLIERLVPLGTNVEQLWKVQYDEWSDFHRQPFDFKLTPPKKKGDPLKVLLSADGLFKDGGEPLPLRLTKKLSFTPGHFHLTADYRLENLGHRAVKFLFLSEWNLTLLAGDAPDRAYFVKGRDLSNRALNSMGLEEGVEEAGMTDGWLKLKVDFKSEPPAKFFRYPVETISQSEGGFERVYQGSCLLFGQEVSLAPRQVFETTLTTQLREAAGS
ncbi:MAG TPA: alpha-amylase/4-alpha-glucanotransferase domain-containing protein [bacterium]|nr:alpha-amylase/4-alpha-glucanotransferase domain-containing protein [bacterium]